MGCTRFHRVAGPLKPTYNDKNNRLWLVQETLPTQQQSLSRFYPVFATEEAIPVSPGY